MKIIRTTPMKDSAIMWLKFISDKINTSPNYQRGSEVWNIDKRQLLIDSILNDFDIGKIYLHLLSKPIILSNGKEAIYAIIDGKQRLETIWQFMDDTFPLDKYFILYEKENLKIGGLKYSEIALKYPEIKMKFDTNVLPIMLVETENLDLIDEMFSRLNEAVPLSSAEKRNAFGGIMPKIITDISLHSFFTAKLRFQNTRYQHKEVAVRLLFLEYSINYNMKIIDTKKVYLDRFVKDFKNKNEENKKVAKSIQNKVKLYLDTMDNIFNNKDILLGTQSNIPIYYLLIKYAIGQNKIENINRNKISEFVKKVQENKKIAEEDITKADFDLLQYDKYTIQGTNDATSIKEKMKIIFNFFNLQTPALK